MFTSPDRTCVTDAQAHSAHSNSRSWQAHANLIAAAWQKGVESILETGQKLLEAKSELDHDVFRSLFQLKKLPFGDRTARRLMAIAAHPILAARTHGSRLPPCWRTLAELARVDHGTLLAALEDGRVNPNMQRKDVRALLGKPSTPKPKTGTTLSLRQAWAAASDHERRIVLDQLGSDACVASRELCGLLSSKLKAALVDRIIGLDVSKASAGSKLAITFTKLLRQAICDPKDPAALESFKARLSSSGLSAFDIVIALAIKAEGKQRHVA